MNDTSALRETYWILRGRQTVKCIIHQHVICLKLEGLPYSSPDLPCDRLSDDPPFALTCIDFAGPLHVQSCGSEESEHKPYCTYAC